MTKVHTRKKRQLMISTRAPYKGERNRSARPKTFGSEEAAKTWAKENDVSITSLKPVKKGKRFEIVSQ